MSDGNEPKPPTQKDIDIERGHAQKFQQERDEALAKLKAFEGIDPADYQKTKEELFNLRKQAAGTDDKKINDLIAEVHNKYKPLLDSEKSTNAELLKRLGVHEVLTPALKLAAEKGFHEKSLTIIERIVKQDCAFENGEVVVKNEKGEIRTSPKDPSRKMTISELLDEIASANDYLIKSDFKKGAGVPSGEESKNYSTNGAQGLTTEQYLSMTPQQREALPINVHHQMATKVILKQQ